MQHDLKISHDNFLDTFRMCAIGDSLEEATQKAEEQGIEPDYVAKVTRAARKEAMELDNRHLDCAPH
ncbi:MAG: hypothetical protein COB14_09765 [Alphaproteobacteria bacterium]|nr:MAG: hypothetical protein COB14_09765 [Alphaproteobacteria bacterium]